MKAPILRGALARLMVTTVFMLSGYVPRRFRVSDQADSPTNVRHERTARGGRSRLRLRLATRG